LNAHRAGFHSARQRFRTRPQRRVEAAFTRECADDSTARRVRQQPQSAIQIRLAGTVRARDDVQSPERQHDLADRAVVGDGERGQHLPPIIPKHTLRITLCSLVLQP